MKTPTPAKHGVVEIASRLDALHPAASWLAKMEHSATAYLEADTKRSGARHLRAAVSYARGAQHALSQGDAQATVMAAMAALQAAWQAEITEASGIVKTGVNMTRGRKPGAVGKLRLAVRAYLKTHPTATVAQMWAAWLKKPPRGLALHEAPEIGHYIEEDQKGKAPKTTRYRALANIVSAERSSSNSEPMKR